MIERRAVLRAYGWLFLGAGIFFVLFPGTVTALVNMLSTPLGARPLQDSGRFWLALAGAMMAMISSLAFSLSRDPDQGAAWSALLISKGISTLLFFLFALIERNPLLLVGAAVDGPIFLHLWLLRKETEDDPWASRAGRAGRPFYEVYFAKLNDPATRSAAWVRFTLRKSEGLVSTGLWCVLFDAPAKRVLVEHWEEPRLPESGASDPLLRLGACSLGRSSMRAEGPPAADRGITRGSVTEPSGEGMPSPSVAGRRPASEAVGAAWDLSWKPRSQGWDFVPSALQSLGAAKSCYRSMVPAGLFEGRVRVREKHLWFSEAWGSVGHLWGRGMAEDWRWAHAVFPGAAPGEAAAKAPPSSKGGRAPLPEGAAVFEILSARARVGPALTPRMTSANLLFQGKARESLGLLAVWSNRTREEEGGWSFRVDFGDLLAEGFCRPDPAMTAELDYADPAGGALLCRNCGVSGLALRLLDKSGALLAEFDTPDGASVEMVARC